MRGKSLRIVVDTNVLFEGLTQDGGAAGLLVEAWLANLLQVHVSTSLAFEYVEVLAAKLAEKRWNKIKPVLGSLLERAEYVPIYYSWRPSSPDPGDDHIIDCAMNANAIVATSNEKDFQPAIKSLGLAVMTPVEFIKLFLTQTEEEE